MDNAKLYFDYNPWWEGNPIPGKYRFNTRREIFDQIWHDLRNDKITSIVGPRRVGKTVLLFQMIDGLLKQKVDPKNIFYLSADDPSIMIEEHIIKDTLTFFEKNILQQTLRKAHGRIFFFLDEIQKSQKWAEYLKKYFDLGYKIKFVVSGSSSIKMIKNTRESLAGRSKEYILYPLSFSEFLSWKEKSLATFRKIPLHFKKLDKLYKELYLSKRKYQLSLEKFIRVGGFPEAYSFSWQERIEYLKKEVVERVLFRDIPEVTKIKNPQLTSRLLTFASSETANVISYQNLSQKLGSRFETISEHLFYLEYSFLISLLKKYSKGGLTVAKSQPKIHVIDPSLILALTNKMETIFAEKDFLGRIVESLVVNHLRFSLDYDNLFFWRDERSEVDIVLYLSKVVLPIEVKYTNKFSRKNLLGLSHFQSKYQSKNSLVLTEDYFGKEEEKIFLPVWFFLLGKLEV